jgi:MFS family permease
MYGRNRALYCLLLSTNTGSTPAPSPSPEPSLLRPLIPPDLSPPELSSGLSPLLARLQSQVSSSASLIHPTLPDPLLSGPGGLYACRFFVGVGEALFGQAIALYLSYHYRKNELAKRVGLFMYVLCLHPCHCGLVAALLELSMSERLFARHSYRGLLLIWFLTSRLIYSSAGSLAGAFGGLISYGVSSITHPKIDKWRVLFVNTS